MIAILLSFITGMARPGPRQCLVTTVSWPGPSTCQDWFQLVADLYSMELTCYFLLY